MKCTTNLRQASWPLALSMLLLTAGTVRADDDPPGTDAPLKADAPPPPGDGPRPEVRRESYRSIVRRSFDPGYQFKMALAPVPRALDAQLDLKGEGVLVADVAEDGPAAKAGIQAYDILLAGGDTLFKQLADVAQVARKSEGKEVTLKVLRAGKPLTITVTPAKAPEPGSAVELGVDGEGRVIVDLREIREIEETIRKKLKDAGVDLRMQVIEPGAFLPKGARFDFLTERRTDLPDDLSINIRKKGKEPADIEVKQGDKTWTVKENDLEPLPEEVRTHVEGYLGRGPIRFNIVGPGAHWAEGPHPPHPPRGPDGRDERPGPGAPRRPEGPPGDAPHGLGDFDAPQDRARLRGSLERRLEELNRRMSDIQDEFEGLRRYLREPREERPERRERPDRPQRPDRPERPEPPENDEA
jgi:hypothetical protein